MLEDWVENLAIITANRTMDDELVIVCLGDQLWKEGDEVCAFNFLNLFKLYIKFFYCQDVLTHWYADSGCAHLLFGGRSWF